MKAAPFDYVAPDSVEAAVDCLAENVGDAMVLAGGQTLMPLLALRMSQPTVLVDINRIEALQGVTRGDGATRIGAVTRQADALTDRTIADHAPGIPKALRFVGHYQTRNRGTVGGSIALGEPAAELPCTALTLGAKIEARSVRGTRLIDAEDFYLGPYTNALESDELVTAVLFPDLPHGTITLAHEVARRPGDFALVGLICALTIHGGTFHAARIGWFGMGQTPLRSLETERSLVGERVSGIDLADVARMAVSETDPADDHHATAAYRRTVGERVFRRAVSQALESA